MELKKFFDTLNVKLVCCGFANKLNDLVCENLSFGFDKLYYLKSGEFNITIGTDTYKADKNSIAVIPSNTVHSITPIRSKTLEVYWIYFNAYMCSMNLFDLIGCNYRYEIGDDEKVTRIFESLLYNTENYIGGAHIINEKNNILSILSYCISDKEICVDYDNITVKSAVEFMENNIDSKITIDDIAKTLGVKRNHCINLFNDAFGQSPIKYLTDIRISKARNLLESTDMSIGEIGKAVGCGDSQTFSKTFKQNVGFSPKKYRDIFGKQLKVI